MAFWIASSGQNDDYTIILLKKDCPICDYCYSTFQNARIHIFNTHKKNIEARNQDCKRNKKDVHFYNNQNAAIIEFCCISCVSTFKDKESYEAHVEDQHIIR